MRLGTCVLLVLTGLVPALGGAQTPPPAASEPALDLSWLPGTYQSIQRLPESALQGQGLGRTSPDDPWMGGIGQPVSGTLTIAANKTFSMTMAYFDEGTWELMEDEKKAPFLRFTGKRDTFDAILSYPGLLDPGEIGLWMNEGEQWFLVQFRKATAEGSMPTDPYAAAEAAMGTMFGQGEVKVDFAEVAKGSSTGVHVQNGAFTKGARFTSPDSSGGGGDIGYSEARVVLIFLPDGRFSINNTLSGQVKSGTYKAEGSELRLKLEEAAAEDVWEIGREQMSGKFAIRPKGAGNFFLELPLEGPQ